jgi:hypothetical protein
MNRVKKGSWDSPRRLSLLLKNMGILLGGGGSDIDYMRRKRISSNYDTHNSVNIILFKRMAFKGTITLCAV